MFEPLDFIARLASLVPTPRVHLTRYHGVFAPNSHLRTQVIPGQRGRRTGETAEEADRPVAAGHTAMTPDRVRGRLWAQRLKRVFKIDIETCGHCGGAVKIIAAIEAPVINETTAWMQEVEQRREQLPKLLTHLNKQTPSEPTHLPESRAPPPAVLIDGPQGNKSTRGAAHD